MPNEAGHLMPGGEEFGASVTAIEGPGLSMVTEAPTTATSARSDAPLALVARLFCLVAPMICLLAPKGTVPLLILTVLAAGAAYLRQFGGLPRPPWPLALTLGALVAWTLLGALWSLYPEETFWRALRAGGLMILGLFLFCFLRPLSHAARDHALRWLMAGWLLAMAVALVEVSFGFPILNGVKGSTGSDYHDLSRLNRGMTAFVIFSWPLAAYLTARAKGWLAVLLLLGLGLVLTFMQSAAAILALLAGSVAFVLCRLHPKAWLALTALILAVAYLGSPAISKALYGNGLSQAEWLPYTARSRIHIWNFTAERIMERPMIGWGLDSGREMPNFGVLPFAESERLRLSQVQPAKRAGDGKTTDDNLANENADRSGVIALHPHNGPLQLLLDLGYVGAGLAYLFLCFLVRPINGLGRGRQAFALATFVSTFAIAATAYGLWQNQWLALMAAGAVALALVSATSRPGEPAS